MIRAVRLHDWKRHASYEAEFLPGLNFVLGRNGSGKSSLLSGIRYGVTGTLAEPASNLIQSGKEVGRVEVDLGDIAVERLLKVDGSSQSIATRPPGKTGQDLEEELIRLTGADGVFLGQLLFLSEGDIYAEQDAYRVVNRQVQRLLPLDRLTKLRASAQALRKPLAKTTKVERSELQNARDEIARLSELEATLTVQLANLNNEIQVMSADLVAKREQLSHRSAIVERRRQALLWRDGWAAFCRTNDLPPDNPTQTLQLLTSQHGKASATLHEALTRRGELSGRQETIKMFLDILATSTDQCPLCHQDLDESHRAQAVAVQRQELSAIEASTVTAEAGIGSAQEEVTQLQSAIQECQGFVATAPPRSDDDEVAPDEQQAGSVAAVEGTLRNREATYAVQNQELGATREKLSSTRSQLALEMEVTRRYRRDALLEIVDKSIGEFERAIQSSVLTPLTDELQNQWKSYRGDSGWALAIADSGELCLRRGTETLPYSAMSGGEKMVALILLRLALVCALTSADFVVLDEPLEHLDPRSRRMLISSLNRAVNQGVLRQVIMSTYEESTARRLYLRSEAHAVFMPDAEPSNTS